MSARYKLDRAAPHAPHRIALKREANPIGVSRMTTTLHSPGTPLDVSTRAALEPRFGHDLTDVRVHADRASAMAARALGAAAFTIGRDIAFAPGRYDPASGAGRDLLAHELAHVVQQTGGGAIGSGTMASPEAEAQADLAACAVTRGDDAPRLSAVSPHVQRRVEMRDVGRGEASGIAQLPALIDRLNNISTALIFRVEGVILTFTENPYGTETEFDRQMKEFVGSDRVIPLRMTNRQALMQNTSTAFDQPVDVDSYGAGYVDIDDLLASSDLGLQTALVHVLRERFVTINYARRMGSRSLRLDVPAQDREFQQSHRRGVASELTLLRDFFGDPTIETIDVDDRIFRNSRRDIIQAKTTRGRGREGAGILAIDFEVRLRDGRRMTPDQYRTLLAAPPPAPAAP